MKVKNLVILRGDSTTIKEGKVTYLSEKVDKQDLNEDDSSKETKQDHALIRSNFNFSQGIVKFKFKAQSANTGVQLVWLDKNHTNLIGAGISNYTKTFRIKDFVNNKQSIHGNLKQFKPNEEISMTVEQFGSDCKLYVNSVLVCELNVNPLNAPLTFRLNSDENVVLYDIEIEVVKPKLFVVMQFSENFNKLYDEVIVPISESKGFEVVRGDEFYTSTPILADIIKSIRESTAIIADITPDNPNVFYEIGYAHAIQKPTILICDKVREKLPFDISSFRTLFYENSIAGKTKIEKSLAKYLNNIIE